MPTYEYECLKCGNEFEFFQSMNSKALTICPKCKGKVKRLIGMGGGIIFKGSGFYATDYKKHSGKKSEAQKPSCPAAKDLKKCHNCPSNPN